MKVYITGKPDISENDYYIIETEDENKHKISLKEVFENLPDEYFEGFNINIKENKNNSFGFLSLNVYRENYKKYYEIDNIVDDMDDIYERLYNIRNYVIKDYNESLKNNN